MIQQVSGSVQRLDQLFSWRCREEPQSLAYAFVRDDLTLSEQLTYQALERKVQLLAKGLHGIVSPGSRILLLFPPGLEIVCAFWACIMATLIPVPGPMPDPLRLKNSLPRLRSIIDDAAASLALTTAVDDAIVQGLSRESTSEPIEWMSLSDLGRVGMDRHSFEPSASTLAYLQYTSGSTTAPRGVMISHRNVLAQCQGLLDRAEVGRDSRSLCWLPYFHDYGLVHGILGPLYGGIPAYLMSPLTFLRRPLRWLEALSRWAITHSGAPNFAYDSCVNALHKQESWNGDLRRWTVASCGAEPIHTRTIDRFCESFRPYGFRRGTFMPAYGLAESTLVVSSTPPGEDPLFLTVSAEALEAHRVESIDAVHEGGRALVGCGLALSGTQIKIVHPTTLTECPPDEVGEIWVSGASVADGYWNRPEETLATFRVEPDTIGKNRYLRTGDLGFLYNDQVFITGRLKDLIILNGRNLYPNDLEAAVEGCHPALRAGGCAAFSVEEQDREQLIIVQELDRRQDLDVDAVATAIRMALGEEFDVPVWAVVLVRPGAIARTSSGKVQRHTCRKAYIDRSLSIIASRLIESETSAPDDHRPTALPENPVEIYLMQLVGEYTGLPPAHIKRETPIVNFGLDSLRMSAIKNRLEQEFGIEVTFAQLFGRCSIRHLASEIGSARTSRGREKGWNNGRAVSTAAHSNGDDDVRGVLSPSQKRLWFLEQMQPGSALNHISLAMRLNGRLDKSLLAASFKEIARRHDMLRAAFSSDGEHAFQTVLSEVTVPIRCCSFDHVPSSVVEEEVRRCIREEALVPFDLAKPPLLRLLVLEGNADDHVLVLTVHRLVADGWSLRLVAKELSAIYNARGDAGGLPTPSGRYEEYAKWQANWDSANEPLQLPYWVNRLRHVPPWLHLPTDRPRPHVRQFSGGARSRILAEEVVRSLEQVCRQEGITKFMVLYAAFTAWLQRCARTTDIVIGSVVANRRLPEWESLVGYFVNTVALRMDLADITTAADLLARARQTVADAYDHQDVPFERVIGALNVERDATPASPFNIMIVWEDDPLLDLHLQDLSVRHLPLDTVAAEFDLTLLIVNGPDGLDLVMLYDRALFDGPTVDRMLRQFESLLKAMIEHPTARLADLSLLDQEERKLVLVDWNRTAIDAPVTVCIPDVIESRMQHSPDALAVVCGESRATYREFQAQSTILAQRICKWTQGGNIRIGLAAERSVHSLIGLFGILKAGAAYVPLDPNAPEQRQRLILEDAGVSLLVTQRHLRSQLPFEHDRVIELEGIEEAAKGTVDIAPLPNLDLNHLAYVIYTSGSTGRPKGVEITHRALQSSLAARLHYYKEPVERCLLTFPLAFDGSITSIFWTLLHGGTVVIPSEDSYRDPHQLARVIARHRISHMVLVPSLYDLVLHDVPATHLSSLQVVVAAGENLPIDVVRRHYERLPLTSLYNEYGPTEATVWSTVYRTNGTEQGMRVPIGKPIANARVYILDSELQPVPIGVVGELYIGGAGVARGYHNQRALTETRFLPNPFLPGTRMYKSGDLGLFRPDGNIEFIGREDEQVKLRGHRIELGEVEAILRELPGIRDAVAVVQDDAIKGPSLVAFVTSDRTPISPSPHLQELLGRRIPSYMVPSAVVVLDALPSLPNGKVDRNALRRQAFGGNDPTGAVPALPRDQIEQHLIELWTQVLGRKPADVHQSFFALGGHSLLATLVVSRIREVFRVELPLRVLFDRPTIAGVAEQIRLEQRRTDSRPPLPPIVPVSRATPLPLSYSQQRMWFIQQLAPEATAYSLLFVSRQKGPLKIPVLRQVVDHLSRRHEAFRTTFAMTGSGLVQRIAPWQSPHLVEVDLRRLPTEQREREARRLAEEEGARPFDLERGPLARISVVTLDHDDHILVLNLHHIVGDQWSFGILGRDFAAYYNALCQDLPLPETALPVQYADYAAWQRRCLGEETLQAQEQYWTRQLADLSILYLPTDFPRPAMQTFRGAYCSIELPETLIDDLSAFSAQRQVTSFMTLLACFQLLLSRYSGQSDVAVGTPIANRTHMAMEQLIGTFVNTLVFRLDLNGNPTFSDLVERVKETALGAFANQDYPFDRLVDQLQVSRDPSAAPLVQVLFNMVNAPIGDIQLFGLQWEPFEVEPGSAQFDLSLTVELEVAKKAYLTFNTDLFMRETAERFLGHFVTLLRHALANPTSRLSDITVLSKAERLRILGEWNRTASDYPRTLCLPELFEAQVQQSPEAVALSMEGTSLTYRQLNAEANRLARLLRGMGVGRRTVVGLCMDRSLAVVTALLAILKAGGTYVPLDPDYPHDRVGFMVEDSGAQLVLTDSTLADRFSGHMCRLIVHDRLEEQLRREAEHDLPQTATAQDLAYVLYTSGSTGQPKGVEIRHRSLVNFLWSMKREPGCSAHDVLLSVTTLSFDIAGLELFLPLIVGARVEIVSRTVAMDGNRLAQCVDTLHPTLMQATPATWRLLLNAGWSGSAGLTALCGGEALPADLAKQVGARTKALWNMYGPTETTIWSTIERVQQGDSDITIGKPIANTEMYVLDAHVQPVPIGVVGELFIGGDGLAQGYHRRPDLTADRFIRHPFSADPEARLYRTGDLARYREDGKLVHMGRVDHQVKIRGFRIELGEVESVLSRHPKVRQAVVTARDDQHGLKQLAAYLVAQEGAVVGAEELRSYLRSVLPDYMVPSFFVMLEKLPLTANKKIDIRALPAPTMPGQAGATKRVAPRNRLEVQLTALWQQVLGIQEIGIHDNFFDLGGHSLKAAQLFFQLEVVFGRQLPLATLFQAPTIAELAAVLIRENWTPPWQSLIAIQPSGSAPPLFMVPGVGGNVLVFAKLARLLGMEQPIYGLQARGLDGKETPFTSVPDMAAHYVQQIRQVWPQGPYRLAGVCTGGLIAYEMAQQLARIQMGATVVMLDTWHPDSYARYRNRLFGRVFMTAVVLGKIAADLGAIIRLPMNEWWASFSRKGGVFFSLLFQSVTDHIQDKDFQVQRLTQATFLAVAHYEVRRFSGRIVNIVASRRRVDDVIPDTRHRWPHLGNQDSGTIHIPAEDSGRLFISPHVDELTVQLRQILHEDVAPTAARTDPKITGGQQI